MFQSVVKGCGAYLPANYITNHDLEKFVDTSHEWIIERTGIERRHIVKEELNSDLAAKAALAALQNAQLSPQDIDAIILATTTPDHPFPATATRVQHKIGATQAFAFDIQAVCSGFVYALSIANNFIKSGQSKHIVVIGSETMSKLVNWKDRSTCVLFGDGAGAFVLSAEENSNQGILSTHLFSDGSMYDAMYVDNTTPHDNKRGHIYMEGRKIYTQAVRRIGQAVLTALAHHNLKIQDIDWFVPHQANQRIIESICENFNIPIEKTVSTIAHHANTSAASIPLAINQAIHDGRIQKGQLVLIEAMGGGLTWGSALIRW